MAKPKSDVTPLYDQPAWAPWPTLFQPCPGCGALLLTAQYVHREGWRPLMPWVTPVTGAVTHTHPETQERCHAT